MVQYWVVYAFLTWVMSTSHRTPHTDMKFVARVFESAVNAVYWFPFFYTFKFILVLWLALPQFG